MNVEYYYDDFGTKEQKLGRKIYHDALSDRRGYRSDQVGIETDDEIWLDIFQSIGEVALKETAPQSPATVDGDVYKKIVREMWDDACEQNLDFETGIYVQELFEKHGIVRVEPYSFEKHGEPSDPCVEEGDNYYIWVDDKTTPQPSPASDQVAALVTEMDNAIKDVGAVSKLGTIPAVWNDIRTALSQAAQPVVSREDAKAALDGMPNDRQHEIVMWRWFMKHEETIRDLLKFHTQENDNG